MHIQVNRINLSIGGILSLVGAMHGMELHDLFCLFHFFSIMCLHQLYMSFQE